VAIGWSTLTCLPGAGKPETEASDAEDIVLLKEIRDLLAARQGGAV
jgi:hypothetical protein